MFMSWDVAMCVCVLVCMSVCMNVCMYACKHKHEREIYPMYIYIYIYIYIHICNIHIYICTHKCVCTDTYIHKCIHYMLYERQPQISSLILYIHTYIHTYIHIHSVTVTVTYVTYLHTSYICSHKNSVRQIVASNGM
jgi:hypothetical protein